MTVLNGGGDSGRGDDEVNGDRNDVKKAEKNIVKQFFLGARPLFVSS